MQRIAFFVRFSSVALGATMAVFQNSLITAIGATWTLALLASVLIAYAFGTALWIRG